MGVPTKYVMQFTHPQRDLPRDDYIGKMAAFAIQPPRAQRWSESESARRIHGVITGFAQIASNHDQTMYEVTLESRLALLRNLPKIRFFFDTNEVEVIQQLLKENGFNQIFADFQFGLYRTYRKRPIITQWQEDDEAFIVRLCRRVGIWFVCDTGERCENVRFGDDFTEYNHDKERHTVPYQEPNGLHTAAHESVQSLTMHSTMVSKSYSVRSYSPEQPHNLTISGTKPIEDDKTVYGDAYTWGLDLDNEQDAKREAELRRDAALAEQVVYAGTCDMLDMVPGCVIKLANRELPEVKYGLLVTGMTCTASRKAGYKVEFTAIPSDRQYRMPLMEETWPRVEGVITGTIASTKDYVGPYLDEHGRYIVQIHADRDARTPGLQSCPLRLAKPYGGQGRTGMHFGLEPDTVVTVAFLWGNVDRPYISQVLHTTLHEDPLHGRYPWAQRHAIHTRANNTLQMDDGEGREHIKLATENGKSQLNLGYGVNRQNEQRSSGVELRTDLHAAIRGGGGVMVSAYACNGASGKQLDMHETVAQLEEALAMAKALASSAQASKAEAADTDSQQTVNKSLDQLHGSGVLVTTPGSAGVVTGKHTQFVADGNIAGVAKGDVSWSTWKRFTVAAHDMVALFTQKGMKLVAAAGDMIVQAQRGRMQLASHQDMSVESVNGAIHVKAAKEIILNVNGTYVKINGGGVEIGSRGGVLYRTAGVKGSGPAQMDLGGAAFAPQFVPYTTGCEVWRTNPAFVPPPAPAPEMNAAETMVAPAPVPDAGGVAPSPLGDFFSGLSSGGIPPGASAYPPFDGKPTNVDSWGPKGKVAIKTPGEQQQAPVTPDPIKLANAVPCDWKITDMKSDIKGHVEATSYWGMEDNRTKWVDKKTGTQYRGGGSRDSYFEFAYSEQDKTITCTVRVMLIPMDLVPVDAAGKPDLTADEQSLPYTFDVHSRMAPGDIVDGVKMVYRDAAGEKYDVGALRNRIEGVLNQGGYKLILDGCSKGAACGCRIKVNFKADLRVSIKGTSLKNFNEHVSLHLYPSVLRADTGSWGEQYKYLDNNILRDCDVAHVEAHECGHYFNFPDEYYARGGWLHESYIKNEQIDFPLVDAKAGGLLWQGRSPTNLMGYGALLAIKNGRATIKPYYLEYVRRQFSLATNKLWRVGYES
ncbi:hypothetical protein LMG9964_00352 [Paraburkholderia phenoliruptrix]|uniref:Actin cross-linking toxin VgrG1 n=2 Tax=Paraburkholderia phenoliruptrix TaxID=252970 RepID=A0A6J5JYI9_9BURK|nr:hypothetical protein LMG9964_00352 [Paraburkholderia phenoliruptrix]